MKKEINIQVLGSGCPTCELLYKRVEFVANKIDPNLKVKYITDIQKLVSLGVMSSPVLAINDKVVTAGQIPEESEIEKIIKEHIEK